MRVLVSDRMALAWAIRRQVPFRSRGVMVGVPVSGHIDLPNGETHEADYAVFSGDVPLAWVSQGRWMMYEEKPGVPGKHWRIVKAILEDEGETHE